MKAVLFISMLFFSFISSAQTKSDSVNAEIFIDQAGENYVIVSAIIKPNQNSATIYFSLVSDGITCGVISFNGTEDSVGYRFRINGLQCRRPYELKWSAYTNDDSKRLCGQKKFKFKAGACPPPKSVADKKKKK